MSRGNNWIPIDKSLVQELRPVNREFSLIEAMFSYSVDIDNGVDGTISGYAKQWRWSRNKVRKFLKDIRTDDGHLRDRKRTHTGHPIHFIDRDLWSKEDSHWTDAGQSLDTHHDTTINPNPNPKQKKKIKKKSSSPSPPTQEEVIGYFLENGFPESLAIKAWTYYEDGDWKDSKGNPVRSWKQKMRGVWFREENKINAGNRNQTRSSRNARACSEFINRGEKAS